MTALPFVHLITGLLALSSAALAGLMWWDRLVEHRVRPAPDPRRRLGGAGPRPHRKGGRARPLHRRSAMRDVVRRRS